MVSSPKKRLRVTGDAMQGVVVGSWWRQRGAKIRRAFAEAARHEEGGPCTRKHCDYCESRRFMAGPKSGSK